MAIKLRVVSTSGDTVYLQVNKILTIDDVPFDEQLVPTPVDLVALEGRITAIEHFIGALTLQPQPLKESCSVESPLPSPLILPPE